MTADTHAPVAWRAESTAHTGGYVYYGKAEKELLFSYENPPGLEPLYLQPTQPPSTGALREALTNARDLLVEICRSLPFGSRGEEDVSRAIAQIDAALAGGETEWMPIESAPKDGRHVMLGMDDGLPWVAEGYYEVDDDRGWFLAQTHWTDAHDGQIFPTRYMNLPLPPPQDRKGNP